MNKLYKVTVDLYIQAPILSSGTGNSLRGIDRMFNRNSDGEFIIFGSHIRGKLREAMKELATQDLFKAFDPDIRFGVEEKGDQYRSSRGNFVFSDFIQREKTTGEVPKKVRISIDQKTGTSDEHHLFVAEQPFKAGTITKWRGYIYFWEETDEKAKSTEGILKAGLKWVTNIGGVKGSGFGRIKNVKTFLSLNSDHRDNPLTPATMPENFNLRIQMIDDLFIGGIANSTSYKESQSIIPGSVLKGSLARHINESCGTGPDTPIDSSNEKVKKVFPNLADFYHAICFAHAFPVPPDRLSRSVVVPFSTIETSDQSYWDVALEENLTLDKNSKAPAFQIDWKEPDKLDSDFGWAECQFINKTRTAINSRTRTASENQLYSFRYISPFPKTAKSGQEKQKINWLAKINLPEALRKNSELVKELNKAIQGWSFLGKRNSRFELEILNSPINYAQPMHEKGLLVDNMAIVTLQTDTFMFNAYSLKSLEGLQELYSQYWKEVTNNSLKLVRFFARQILYGGYYGKPQFRVLSDGYYYPFVLTKAGSVFVLEANDGAESKASLYLSDFLNKGLPFPKSILDKLSTANIPENKYWHACPFVRENGYAEVRVNLNWHWEKKYSNNKGKGV